MTHLIKSIQLIIPADALKMPKLIGGGGDALVLGSSRQNIHNSMARLAHSAHDQACHSLHSAGKSSGSKVFLADVSQKHHRKFDAPAETEGSAVLEDSRSAMPEKSRCLKMSSPSSPSCSFILARHLATRSAWRFDRSRWRCPRHCEGARLQKEPALCSSGMPEMLILLDWHKFAGHPSQFLL